MKLYLVRHGEAVSSAVDPNQSLSAKGREETALVASRLKAKGIELDEIIHSVKARAKETAAILGEAVAPDLALIEREGLKPMDPIEPLLDEIRAFDRHVMIVGHLPFMERLLTTLLYGEERTCPVAFSGSTIVCLEGEGSSWSIAWTLSAT